MLHIHLSALQCMTPVKAVEQVRVLWEHENMLSPVCKSSTYMRYALSQPCVVEHDGVTLEKSWFTQATNPN